MRNPTSYGTVSLIDKKSKRRKPYRVQIHVGWTDEGKPIRKTIGYAKTRVEGRQILAEYHDKPFDTDIKNATWKYVYNKWLEYKKETQTIEFLKLFNGADEENRTPVLTLARLCSTIKLHPQIWRGLPDLNR